MNPFADTNLRGPDALDLYLSQPSGKDGAGRTLTGILQADAYAGYEALYADGQIVEAACWAHARRKFFELAKAQSSPIATEALKRIAALYAIEAEIRGQLPQARQAMRQARADPLLDEFKGWLTERLSKLSRKSALAEAMGYALKRWAALNRYASNGRIEIDNNAAERALRTVALGRKNDLFAGSDAGASVLPRSTASSARLPSTASTPKPGCTTSFPHR